MKYFLIGVMLCCFGGQSLAQVDIAHRRTLTLESGTSVYHGHEALGGYGYFWFNEDHFPWDRTALRVNYAGVYLDSELSYFLTDERQTAVGVRLGGGVYSDDVHPYVDGDRLRSQSFDGDAWLASVFVNHEITKIAGKIPLNIRGTYMLRHTSYRESSDTSNFVLPVDFYTRTAQLELRLGGFKREITAREGLTVYVLADTNHRTRFEPFGPVGAPFPDFKNYQRLLGQVGAKIPIKNTTFMLLLTGGTGRNLDELSAWRLGGNLVNADPTFFGVHGYYIQEFFARDFGLANFEVTQIVNEKHNLTLHFYADYATERAVPPDAPRWRGLPGVGAGVGFRAPWKIDVLLNYGYGFEAVRNGTDGGHEVALALEKLF